MRRALGNSMNLIMLQAQFESSLKSGFHEDRQLLRTLEHEVVSLDHLPRVVVLRRAGARRARRERGHDGHGTLEMARFTGKSEREPPAPNPPEARARRGNSENSCRSSQARRRAVREARNAASPLPGGRSSRLEPPTPESSGRGASTAVDGIGSPRGRRGCCKLTRPPVEGAWEAWGARGVRGAIERTSGAPFLR